jgi:hypothetical protein
MTSKTNVWEAVEFSKNRNGKNIVVFSLNSLGRSDLHSIPAGGSGRKVQRQQQIKNSTLDIIINGKDFKAVPSKNGGQKKGGKPVSGKPAKAAKAAKPAKAAQSSKASNQNVSRAQIPKRPKGVPRSAWRSLTLAEKSSYIPMNQRKFYAPEFSKKIGPHPKVGPVHRNIPIRADDGVSNSTNNGFGAPVSNWDSNRYHETAEHDFYMG